MQRPDRRIAYVRFIESKAKDNVLAAARRKAQPSRQRGSGGVFIYAFKMRRHNRIPLIGPFVPTMNAPAPVARSRPSISVVNLPET